MTAGIIGFGTPTRDSERGCPASGQHGQADDDPTRGVGPLARACERALVAGAPTQRAGTRQQVRAAARRFVRRHGRDDGYLRWVLRSVGASSALAVERALVAGVREAQSRGTPAVRDELDDQRHRRRASTISIASVAPRLAANEGSGRYRWPCTEK